MKTKKQLTPLTPEELDAFVIAIITALKGTEDSSAIAEVKNLLITPALTELLLFVGVTPKQADSSALFAWTEVVNTKITGGKNASG